MMRTHSHKSLFILALAAWITVGCEPPTPPTPPDTGHAGHDHAETGPHDGQLVAFGDHAFHAELVTDGERATFYILDGDAKKTVHVPIQEAVVNLTLYGNPEQFKIPSAPQEGDPPASTSCFEINNLRLVSALNSEAQHTAELTISKDGKPYIGKFESHDHHGHSHGHGHGEDNRAHEVLSWHKQDVELAGYTIRLGQHGLTVRAGKDLEPAVTIIQNGESAPGAQVYATLVAEDGKTVLSKETLAVYEEAKEDEPAHYAQNVLKVPKGARRVVIRYRIVLPDGAGNETYEVRLDTVAPD